MGRKADQRLVKFVSFLFEVYSLKPTTVKTYTSHVRKCIRACGMYPEADRLDEFFKELHVSSPLNYATIRRSWALYREWRLTQGQNVALPGNVSQEGRRQETASLEPLPAAVRTALRVLKANGMNFNDFPDLDWGLIGVAELLNAETTTIRDPKHTGVSWLVPSESLKVLWDYAAVQENRDLSLPLVPRSPGNSQPYPYRALLKETNKYTEEEWKAKISGQEQYASALDLRRGSALKVDVPTVEEKLDAPVDDEWSTDKLMGILGDSTYANLKGEKA